MDPDTAGFFGALAIGSWLVPMPPTLTNVPAVVTILCLGMLVILFLGRNLEDDDDD